MSWTRILNTARRNGIPLIVTDSNGDEPMVVLPLEQFEAMSSMGSEMNQQEKKVQPAKSGLHRVDLPIQNDRNLDEQSAVTSERILESNSSHLDGGHVAFEEIPFGKIDNSFGDQDQIRSVDFSINTQENADLDAPLEEQFFLEPLEDEENG
ncbi:MAG: hypothetical protein NUV81_02400 [bacterium]|nr:hypothetical protein [bacterium]